MDWEIIGKEDGAEACHTTAQDTGSRLFVLPAGHKGTGIRLDNGQIKAIALALMVLDHAGAMLLPYGSIAWFLARGLGRLSFPLYAYLAGQGIGYTHDIRAYSGRLLICAVLSELPFDLAAFGEATVFSYQNVFFTLALAVMAFHGYQPGHGAGRWKLVLRILCAGMAAKLICADYGASGVFLIGAMACMGRHKRLRAAAVWCFLFAKCGWLIPGLPVRAVMAMAGAAAWAWIAGMDSRKPGKRKWKKWFYAAYPVHLTVLWLFRMTITRI